MENEQAQLDREMPDEHGPMNLNESTILARAMGSTPLAKLGAMGHEGSDDYATCLDARHWQKLPEGMRRLSDEERQMLLDEIEMDML